MKQMEQTKKDVLKALERSLGVVSTACKKANIGRTTFYRWIQDDPEFKAAVDEISEMAVDTVESKLFDLITKQENVTATIFYLKTKGKSRGYVEKQEIDLGGGVTSTLVEWKPAENE